ncbi:MAG: Zn-ribbon domain-containing OB-fold protein [Candidatus Heimdallarchaeota archaeon]
MVKKENEKGYVDIVKGRYKPRGFFHHVEENQPIFNKDTGKLAGVTNPRDMTYIHSYGSEAIFFESLSKGKLMASRCDNDACETKGSIYEPFRIYCPDCLRKATPIDITDKAHSTAKIHSFIVTHRSGAFNTLPKPIKFINVEFDAEVVTILMSVLAVGEPEIGKKIIPIFRTKSPTYTILDLMFVPEGTSESMLPEGFTF